MRVYGRINGTGPNGVGGTWVVVQTDANGFDDEVYLVALIQCLLLNLGESPFYADAGIPAQSSAVSQVFPDFYASLTQQRFAQFFPYLAISRMAASNPPFYQINATLHTGAIVSLQVPL